MFLNVDFQKLFTIQTKYGTQNYSFILRSLGGNVDAMSIKYIYCNYFRRNDRPDNKRQSLIIEIDKQPNTVICLLIIVYP